MKFIKTKLDGGFVVEVEKSDDERGFFSNIWDKKKFQENMVFNPGLSWQFGV